MNKSDIFWQTYLNLEKELLEVAKYIYITDEIKVCENGVLASKYCDKQLETYSPYIADLLIRVCVEIEAISKELYFELGGKKQRGDNTLLFDRDCLSFINQKCKTEKKTVLITCPAFDITSEKNRVFMPLKKAHKGEGADWNRAYQALKHDRFASLNKGSVNVLIHAFGALYLLNIYNRNIRIVSKYMEINNVDYSFGSSVFSLETPNQRYVIDIVNNVDVTDDLESDSSPFILKYTNNCYAGIMKANTASMEKMQKYLLSQPEMKEPEFLLQIQQVAKLEKANCRNRLMVFWELCKYRLNKRIPKELPFEERKRLFVSSPEWNGTIRQNNSHLEESELTEENIQAEIDSAGVRYGMELQLRFEAKRMGKAFREGYCELVLDKGNVRYQKTISKPGES